MKNFRTTFIFAFIVIAICVFAFMELEKGKEQEATDSKSDQIYSKIDYKTISSMSVTRTDGEPLSLKRESGTWSLNQPIQDLADTSLVESFIKSFLEEDISSMETQGKEIKWEMYGLDQPMAEFTFSKKGGSENKFSVGSKQSFDGGYFIRKGQENKILLGDSSWKAILEKKGKDLRRKVIFRNSGDLEKFSVTTGKDKSGIHLEKKDTGWVNVKNVEMKMDQQITQNFISNIKNLEASEFTSETSAQSELKKYGLSNPYFSVDFSFTGGDQWNLKVSQKQEGNYYAKSSHGDTIYKIESGKFDPIDKDLDGLRDKKFPFQIDISNISEIRVKTSKDDVHIAKDNNVWKLVQNIKTKKVVPENVKPFLEAVKKLSADHFLTGNKDQVVAAKINFLDLIDNKGNEVLSLVWDKKVKREKYKSENLFYAKSNTSDELFGIGMFKITDLPYLKMVTDKKQVKANIEKKNNEKSEKKNN